MERLASKISLQDAEAVLHETLARLKETKKMEGEAAKSPQKEEEVEHIMEPNPQPSLGSYYNFLDAEKARTTKTIGKAGTTRKAEITRTAAIVRIAGNY